MPATLLALRRRVAVGRPIDRKSAADARAVLERLLPSHIERRVVVEAMIAGVQQAHAQAEGAWSLTLFAAGLRLNVGRLLILEVLDAHVWAFVSEAHPRSADLQPYTSLEGRDPSTVDVATRRVLIPAAELPTVLEAFKLGGHREGAGAGCGEEECGKPRLWTAAEGRRRRGRRVLGDRESSGRWRSRAGGHLTPKIGAFGWDLRLWRRSASLMAW